MSEAQMESSQAADLARGKRRSLIIAVGLVFLMTGLAFAAVPAYRLFCQITGFGGTPLRAEDVADSGNIVSDRTITVLFTGNVNKGMPWKFEPVTARKVVRIGEPHLMYYRAHNPTNETITGMATFNVEPEQLGKNFVKIECFCFQRQELKPGETVEMPVTFYVHSDVLEESGDVERQTVTLSYTFFRRDDLAAEN